MRWAVSYALPAWGVALWVTERSRRLREQGAPDA